MKKLTAAICVSVLALSSVTAYAGPSISEMVPESVTVTNVVGELPENTTINVVSITPEMAETYSEPVQEILAANNDPEGTTLTVDQVAETLDAAGGEVIGEKPEDARYLTAFSAIIIDDGTATYNYDEEGNIKSFNLNMEVPQLGDLAEEDKENIVYQVVNVNTCDTQYCEVNWDLYPPTVTIEDIKFFGIGAFAQAGLANEASADSLEEAPTEEAAGEDISTEG
jgi:hypothetical protein